MQLISLNIWGGHLEEELLQFFVQHQDVEVFCLQEVYSQADKMITKEDRYVCLDILSKIKTVLPEHTCYFSPVVNDVYGLAILVKKHCKVLGFSTAEIYSNPDYPGFGPTHNRILQHLRVLVSGTFYNIVNIHGLWNGRGKTDSPQRIQQSEKINQYLKDYEENMLMCGDFNLRPDTESFQLLAKNRLDLIQSHQVTDTRTRYYEKEERFADYMLTSSDIVTYEFAVLSELVSDHAALFINCDVRV